ncbi:MAG: RidA family protein [Pseudolabrys sp.]|jgi:reactive intermediate/imine deaminase
MKKEIIRVPGLTDAVAKTGAPLSILVKAGDFLYCSGLPPLDPKTGELVTGDIQTQTRAVLDALKYALEHAGSSLDNVVKTTIFITNAAYFKTVNDIYRTYFPNDPPARTFVAVASWPLEFDIEIECVALA